MLNSFNVSVMQLAVVNIVQDGRLVFAGRHVRAAVPYSFGIVRRLRYLPDPEFSNTSRFVDEFFMQNQRTSLAWLSGSLSMALIHKIRCSKPYIGFMIPYIGSRRQDRESRGGGWEPWSCSG